MKDPYKRRYLYLMLSIFGAISGSVVVFFVMYRFRGIGDVFHTLSNILAPFIYGGVVAYLLRPMCNFYEQKLVELLPKKMKKMAESIAVGLSLITGILIVYLMIAMIAPQLYDSIVGLWRKLPTKVNQFLAWAQGIFGEDEEILQMFNTSYNKLYAELETWLQNTLMPYVTNIISGVGSSVYKVLMFVYNLLIGLIVAFSGLMMINML